MEGQEGRGGALEVREDPMVQDCIRSVEELYRRVKDDPTTQLGAMCRSTLIHASRISGCALEDPSLVQSVEQAGGRDYEDEEEGQGGGGGSAGGDRARGKGAASPASIAGADEAAPLGGEAATPPVVGCLSFGWKRRRPPSSSSNGGGSPAWSSSKREKGNHSTWRRGVGGRYESGGGQETAEYEAAPIVDICAVFGSDPVPAGFRKIAHTPYGRGADLNAGAGGHYIYLCYRKDLSRQKPPIVSLVVIFPGRKEFLPPTFSVVRRKGEPVDFNAGTSSESVYLCFKRGAGNPITDLQVLFPRKHEVLPRGYTLLDRTPFKYDADLNAGGSSTTIFLCYKQWLRNVDEMNGNTSYGLLPEGHAMFNSNGQQSRGTRGSSSPAGGLQDETQSLSSSRALNVLWGHADTTHTPRDQLIPALRRSLLTPLITALYSAPSDTVGVALDHLLRLGGRHLLGPASRGDESEEALQEVLVEALCYFNNRVQAERFDDVVQYLRSVIPGPSARRDLPPSTLQQVFTTCVFLCNFEAYRDLHTEVLMARRESVSAPPPDTMRTATAPPLTSRLMGGGGGASGPTVPLAPHTTSAYTSLLIADSTQGSDCAAYASLRYLIQETLRRFEVLDVPPPPRQAATNSTADGPPPPPPKAEATGSKRPWAMVREVVAEVVEGAVDHVELAKTTQRALDCIRRSNAFSYESFWKEIQSAAEALADSPVAVNTFLVLAAICKLASEQPRLKKTGEMVERDVAGKLIALDLLNFLLRKGGDRFVNSRHVGCQVRRVVVSCLVSNVLVGLDDVRVLRRVLIALSTLWRSYRPWLKIEMGLLWDQVLYRILRFRPFRSILPAQVAVLSELVTWLEVEPNSLVELYLNYDLDRSALTVRQQLLAFQQLVVVMCSLGEDLGAAVVASRHEDESELRSFYLRALQAVALLTRSLMNASGHANLIPQDAKVRAISLDQQLGGGWEQDVLMPLVRRSWGPGEVENLLLEEDGEDDEDAEEEAAEVADEDDEDEGEEEGEGGDAGRARSSLRGGGKKRKGGDKVPLMDSSRARQQASSSEGGGGKSLSLSLSLSTSSLRRSRSGRKRGGGAMPRHPPTMGHATSVRLRQEQHKRQEGQVQEALKLYKSKGLKKAIQYLVASGFMSDTPRDIAAFLRAYRYELDPVSMGDFLGEGGNGTDTAYWNLIRMKYIRASSFHNMALEPALRYFLTKGGFRLPGEGQKADRILQVFGTCYFEDNKSLACCPFTTADGAYMTSYAIIMLQTDLHKANTQGHGRRKRMTRDEFVANTRHIAPELSREYLGDMYDSILHHPIEELLFLPSSSASASSRAVTGGVHSGRLAAEDPAKAEALTAAANRQEMATALRGAEELLTGLSVYPDRFSIVGVNANLTPDVVKLMFESVWFTLHILIASVLDKAAQSDPEAIVIALDIVMYATSASVFLDLNTPGAAFASQLGKFKSHQEKASFGASPWKPVVGPGSGSGAPGEEREHEKEKWFQDISRAVGEAKWSAIGHFHALISDLKESVQQSRIREELKAVAKRIEPRANLLDDGSRRFIREGDLMKRCRSGKVVKYRFFLFSDQLLYAHRKLSGEYKVHAQLILSVMKVANVESDRRDCSFQILHCPKSFVVVAESPEMKRIWMRDILEAKSLCLGLKDAAERQLSVISRLHVESERVMALIQLDDVSSEQRQSATRSPSSPVDDTAACESSPLVSSSSTATRGASMESPAPPTSTSTADVAPPPPPPTMEPRTARLLTDASAATAASSIGGSSAGGLATSELDLELVFFHALLTYRAMLQVDQDDEGGVMLQDEDGKTLRRLDGFARAVLDGLFLQYHLGDFNGRNAPGGASEAAVQSWKAHVGMSQTAAMTCFIKAMHRARPDLQLTGPPK